MNMRKVACPEWLALALALLVAIAGTVCVMGVKAPQAQAATKTYTLYFHRNYSDPSVVAKKVTTKDTSKKVGSFYAPSVKSGAVAGYGVSAKEHYLYYLTSSGNCVWQASAKKLTAYPFSDLGTKPLKSAGYTLAKFIQLTGVKGTSVHLYLYLKPQAHSFAVKQQPTCTVQGSQACKVCGHVQVLAALGHSYKSAVTQQPTCSMPGVRTYTCTRCATSYTEGISPTGKHNYTYASQGNGTHLVSCSVCSAISYLSSCVYNDAGVCKYCGYKGSSNATASSSSSSSLHVTVGKVRIGKAYYFLKANKTASYARPVHKRVKRIVIPARVSKGGVTYKVTGIRPKACRNCSCLKKVTGGKYLKAVGARAFQNCSILKKVRFSSTCLAKLGKNSFKGCSALTTFSCKSDKVTNAMLKKAGVL